MTFTQAELQKTEKKLVGMLRNVRKITKSKTNKGGGWNKKDIQEHLAAGSYRVDRHGPLPIPTLNLKKPPGKIVQTARAAAFWVRNPSDQYAINNGCRFNERLAEYTTEFFSKFLHHSKGQWAGKSFELTNLQRDEIIYPLFGWVRPDGRRRFRRTYIEMPKKNGKSTLASGIGLYMLVADGEPGAEIWSLGADRDQARIVHNEAIHMIEASEKLASIIKINRTNFNLEYKIQNSWYRAVSAAPRAKQGANLHCAIIDELHEWFGTELWEQIRYAFRARREPLSFVITNAGNDLQSICYRQREKAAAILGGTIVDDDFFALISAVPKVEADAEIEAVSKGAIHLPIARKCNLGIDVIISESDLARDIKDAIQTPSELPNLLRLTYGVWNTGVSAWLNSQDWAACAADFSETDLELATCTAGLDMSRTRDMTALALIFPDDEIVGKYRQLVYFWMPQKTMLERQHLVDYKAWVDAGLLRVGGDKVIETENIEADIQKIFAKFSVSQMAFDPMYVDETRLSDTYPDVEAVKFPQTIMQFAAPTAEYERLIIANQLLHNGNEVLTWQAGHCVVKSDLNKNIRPVKPEHGDIRTIDGIVAGIMALRLSMMDDITSAYESDNVAMYVDDIVDNEDEVEDDIETMDDENKYVQNSSS